MPDSTLPRTSARTSGRRLTKSQRLAQDRLFRYAWEQSRDYLDMDMIREMVPEAWHTLEQDIDVDEKKEKVTLYLDYSVARFYRAMGPGYHARINRLLGTWAQMKIAELLDADARISDGIGGGFDAGFDAGFGGGFDRGETGRDEDG